MPLHRDRSQEKVVLDNVHDYIHIDPLTLRFIDTSEFQRLRDVKQLGLCNLVYPGATHSRFEHSLGVYHLASTTVQRLDRYWPWLEIEQADLQAVSLAGLLHDVGHGPFSHVFENEFLPRVFNTGIQWRHENMSTKMVDYIVDENHIDIDIGLLKRVKDLILGGLVHNPVGDKAFLYDIVANGRNSIDVDKFDYIVRDCRACGLGLEPGNFKTCRLMDSMKVIDNEICYKAGVEAQICELFVTRASLFRKVYTHAKVKAMELMLTDVLVSADPYLGISAMVNDPEDFCQLDDSILKVIEYSKEPELKEAKELIKRMRSRGKDLYQFCNEAIVPKHLTEEFPVRAKDIFDYVRNGANMTQEDILVSNVKIDLTCKKQHVLEGVHFFNGFESLNKFEIQPQDVTGLYSVDSSADCIVRVYVKKHEHMEAACKAFEKFVYDRYNKELHGTPECKRRKT